MSNYDFLTLRKRKQSLFIVEGNHEKNVLMKLLLKVFPEMSIKEEDILIFGTNIYMLYTAIVKEYEADWDTVDVDLAFLVSKMKGYESPLNKDDFNNIILIFDYERHDPSFSEEKIGRLQRYFIDSTDVGKLFLNYPMIESYQHFVGWPGNEFEHEEVSVTVQPGNQYKNMVKDTMIAQLVELSVRFNEILEEKFGVSNSELREMCVEQLLLLKDRENVEARIEDILKQVLSGDEMLTAKYLLLDIIKKANYCKERCTYYEYVRRVFVEIIRQNICKARKIVGESYNIPGDLLHDAFEMIDFSQVLDAENEASRDAESGVIKVLNTSVLLVPDYNFSLIEN